MFLHRENVGGNAKWNPWENIDLVKYNISNKIYIKYHHQWFYKAFWSIKVIHTEVVFANTSTPPVLR